MTGCQWLTKQPQPQALQIPANLKQPCPDLKVLSSGHGAEVLKVMVDDRRKYVECANSKKALIKAIEKPTI